jgi:hypothetical protein
MKFAAEIKNNWDHGMVGTALADWCQHNPSSAAQMIERLRDQNSGRLTIINKKLDEIDQWRMIVVNLESQLAPPPS